MWDDIVHCWSKYMVVMPCFDHLTKMSPVVTVTWGYMHNWSRYIGYKLIHTYGLLHSYRLLQSYRLLCIYRLLCTYRLLHSYRLIDSYSLLRSVKMNGFNSTVICKNSSVTIWEILFNIAMPIIHQKLYSNEGTGGGRVCHNNGIVCHNNLSLWTPPPGLC